MCPRNAISYTALDGLALSNTEESVQPLAHAVALQRDRACLLEHLLPVADLVEYSSHQCRADDLVLTQPVRALAVSQAGHLGVPDLAVAHGEGYLQLETRSVCNIARAGRWRMLHSREDI